MRPSRSIEITPDAIIDVLLEKYQNDVLYNLAPGATFFGPSKLVKDRAISILVNDDEKSDALSKYGDVIGDNSLRTLWANVLAFGSNAITSLKGRIESFKSPEQLFPSHELMITAGANQGFVNIITSICDSGDEIILIHPYYFSHYNALVMYGINPVCVPVNPETFLPKVEDILEHVTKKCRGIVIVNPGNPSGIVYPKSILDKIVKICRDNSIWLVIDEAYREFNYDEMGTTAPSTSLEDHIIKLYTMSKAYGLAGWRIGAVLYPRSISRAMRKAQDTIPTHATRFSQVVAYEALLNNPFGLDNNGGYIGELNNVRNIFLSRLRKVYDVYLPRNCFVTPNGAFYIFIPYTSNDKMENITIENDMWVVKQLVEKFQVLICPGFAFGMKGYLRISYGTIRLEEAHKTVEMLSKGMDEILNTFIKK